jgi:DNA-binding MarR family transcriptional regulator
VVDRNGIPLAVRLSAANTHDATQLLPLVLRQLHQAGEHNIADLAELFSVSRPTVYRVLKRGKIADAAAG